MKRFVPNPRNSRVMMAAVVLGTALAAGSAQASSSPNPKAVQDIKGGKINFRVDKQANLHFVIGKASFDEKKLAENYGAAIDEILRAKPSSSKGRYLKKITVSTTTGPGIREGPGKRGVRKGDSRAPLRSVSGEGPGPSGSRCSSRGEAVALPRSGGSPSCSGSCPAAGALRVCSLAGAAVMRRPVERG